MAILQNEHISPLSIGTGTIPLDEQAARKTVRKDKIVLSPLGIV